MLADILPAMPASLSVVSFHTPGSYARESDRMVASIKANAGPLDSLRIVELPDGFGWYEATAYKATFLRDARRKIPGPIVWIDADAYVHGPLASEFDSYSADNKDFACHYRRGKELLSGTMWFNDTPGARTILQAWCEENTRQLKNGIQMGGGQRNLQRAIERKVGRDAIIPSIARLPAKLCWIFDMSRSDYPHLNPDDAVIEHLQASREHRRGQRKNHARQRRIATLDGKIDP